MKKYLAALAVLSVITVAGCTCHKKDKILFDTDSYTLTKEDKAELDQAAVKLKKKEVKKVSVYGYTDSTGTEEHNKRLSKARARSAASYLEGKGIASDRITVTSFGAENPVASNKTKEGRKANRRVELRFHK